MAAFEYKALDAKGKRVKGLIEGDNPRQARQRLKEKGLVPIDIVETSGKSSRKKTRD